MAEKKKTRSFADDLIARGVNPQVAHLFTTSTGLATVHQQAFTQEQFEQFVGARSPYVTPTPTQTGQKKPASAGTGGKPFPTGGSTPTTPTGSGAAQATPASQTPAQGQGGGVNVIMPGGYRQNFGAQGAGSQAATPAAGTAPDWTTYLSDWGFTDEMKQQISQIFATTSDSTVASAKALAYIRGTPWYQQHFPGIGSGIQNGLVTDEASYRAYVNAANQAYQQYLGRAPTSDEIAQYLAKGWNTTMIGQHLVGQAWINDPTNNWNVQYQLGAFDSGKAPNAAELAALGDTEGGLGNKVGDALASRLQAAQQKFTRIFEGIASTPSVSMLSGGQLSARGANTKADVSA